MHATIWIIQLDVWMQLYMWLGGIFEDQYHLRHMHDADMCRGDVHQQLHQPGKSPVPELHGSTRKLLVGERLHVCMQRRLISGLSQQLLEVHLDYPVSSWILQD